MTGLTRYEKKVLAFLAITFLLGTSVLLYKTLSGSQGEIYIKRSQRPHTPCDISAATHLININTASAQELASLPGIGAKLAERIVKRRNEVGDFKLPDELKKVDGIGERKFEKIKDRIAVH